MSKNIYEVKVKNPLILVIKIEPDTVQDGMPAVTPNSLSEVRRIINTSLLIRHYKLLIVDIKGLVFSGSALMAKYLMCYEKALSVKCKVVTINLSKRIYGVFQLAGLDALIECYDEETSPKEEDYSSFFGIIDNSSEFVNTKLPVHEDIDVEDSETGMTIEEEKKIKGDEEEQATTDDDSEEQILLYSSHSL